MAEKVKDAQAAQRESEEKYRRLMDTANDAIFLADCKTGIILEANKKGAKLLGRRVSEIIGMHQSQLHPPEVRAEYKRLFRMYLKQGGGIARDLQIVDKRGRRVPVDISASVTEVNGREVMLGIFRDVTERQEAEEALRAGKELTKTYLDIAGVIIVVTNPDLTVRLINKTGCEILEYPAEEIIGKKFDHFLPKSIRPGVKSVFKDIMAGKVEPHEYSENPLRSRTGKERMIAWHNTVLKDEKGRTIASLSSGLDITERKLAEAALKQRDQAIRQAYMDVFYAVTGGKLIIMSENEVQAALGRPAGRRHQLTSFAQLSAARSSLRRMIKRRLPNLSDPSGLVLAIAEALTNGVKHGGGAYFQVFETAKVAQVLIDDVGPGIDFSVLPKATLMTGFSTKASLGIGFSVMLEICDRVLLSTRPGRTRIVLEMGEARRARRAA